MITIAGAAVLSVIENPDKPHKMKVINQSIEETLAKLQPLIPHSFSNVLWIFAQNCALPPQQIILSKTL